MQNRWFHAPQLHTPDAHTERKVAWLELFYDLIYVATIIQLGNALSHHVSFGGFLAFFALFVPLWYSWTGFTFYSNRFMVDDALHRGLVFIQMFAVGAMAVSVPRVLEHDYALFAGAYAVARWVLVALYFRTWKHTEEGREVSAVMWRGFGVAAVIWTLSPLLTEPWVYVAWAVAMAIDLSVPLTRKNRELTGLYPPDLPHMTERYGLLTIIVLGESFVKILSSVAEKPGGPGTDLMVMAGLAVVVTCCLWWIYFDDVAGSRIKDKRLAFYAWVYMHLPLVVGITAVGVAVKKVVFFDPGEIAPAKYRWLLCGSLALALFSVAVIDYFTERREADLSDKNRVNMRFGSGIVVLLLAPAGGFMSSLAFGALVSLACIGQVLFDLWMAPQGLSAEDLHHHEAEEKAQLRAAAEARRASRGEPEEEQPGPRKYRYTAATADAVRIGAPNDMRRDLYYQFMEGSWGQLGLFMTLAYLFTNVIFASLFLLEAEGVAGLSGHGFLEAFSFSVQTLTTIGYGTLSPESPYAHTLVAVEALIGLLGVALVTGLVFAKASRPQSSVLFSDGCVIGKRHGVPTLEFRLANARGNDVVEATVRVSLLVTETTPEGHSMRRLHDLKLSRDRSPVFTLSWSVMHTIDETSPLDGLTLEQMVDDDIMIIVTMSGWDLTYANNVHARQMYYAENVTFDHRFIDVLSRLDDGRMQIDMRRFHETEPQEGTP